MTPVLSRSSEYAIRALTWLAQHNDERFHLARDMAEVLGIPAPFLGKVLQPLVSHGVLFSQRGRSGGFRLARHPSEIKLRQIVETQEHLERAKHCILGQSECSEGEVCPLHNWWSQTSEKFFAMLDTTTLADMALYQQQHPDCRYPLPIPMEIPRAPLPAPAATPELSVHG